MVFENEFPGPQQTIWGVTKGQFDNLALSVWNDLVKHLGRDYQVVSPQIVTGSR